MNHGNLTVITSLQKGYVDSKNEAHHCCLKAACKIERKRPLGHSTINLSTNINLLHCYWKEKHRLPWEQLLPSLSVQIPVSQAWGTVHRA